MKNETMTIDTTKVLVLAGKAVPKIIREDKLCEMAL